MDDLSFMVPRKKKISSCSSATTGMIKEMESDSGKSV